MWGIFKCLFNHTVHDTYVPISHEQVSDNDYRLTDLLYGQVFVIVFYVE